MNGLPYTLLYLLLTTGLLAVSVPMVAQNALSDTGQIMQLYATASAYLPSRPDTAHFLSTQGLNISRKLSFDRGILYHQFLLGSLLHEQGFDDKALATLEECLPICEKLGDWEMEAQCYNEMGKWVEMAGDKPQAIRYYEKVAAIGQTHKSVEWMTTGLHNLGDSYELRGNFLKAERYYLEGIKVAQAHKDKSTLLFPYLGLAHLYIRKQQYEQALDFSLKAISISEQTRDWYAKVLSSNFATEALLAQNKADEALTYAQLALSQDSLLEGEMRVPLAQTYALLSQIYEKKGNVQNALAFYKRGSALTDSLIAIQNTQNAARLKKLFKAEYNSLQSRLTEMQNKNKISQLLMMIGACFSLLVLVFLPYQRIQYRKQNSDLMAQKEEELWEQNETIAAQKQEIAMQAEELQLLNGRLYEWNQHLEKLVQQRTENLELKVEKLKEEHLRSADQFRALLDHIAGLVKTVRQLASEGSTIEAIELVGQLESEIQAVQQLVNKPT